MSDIPRPALRWAVPVGVTALVLGGAVLGPALSASAEVELPERAAAQLLTDLQTAEVEAFSGTVSQRADLGLPALPEGMGDEDDAALTSLLTGEHTLRVWASGEKARVALHGRLDEADVVTDGTTVWVWSSEERTATRLTLPEHQDRDEAMAEAMPPATPEAVTDYVLGALDASTTVRSGPNSTVAGRPAYELVLEPKGEGSLIRSVRIAVDAEQRVATRVQVYGTGDGAPALDVGFTELSFAVPDDDVFAFTPPAGATVEERTLDGHESHHALPPHSDGTAGGHGAEETAGPKPGAVVGTGWTAVAVGRAPAGLDGTDGELAAFVRALPRVSGTWGSGRLLTSTLFSALLTDDGRLLVGAVDGDALQAAAADPRADLG
jgi:outer membrane lipoprotein-sorting protein